MPPKPSAQSTRATKPAVSPAKGTTDPVDALAWTFMTNHLHVLLCIAKEPEIRIRDIAALVGITERMVQKLVTELVTAGYLGIEKHGRRNRYTLNRKLRLRHPLEAHHTIGEVLDLLATP
jgi:DNA-binding IclR family transcriptional regulator